MLSVACGRGDRTVQLRIITIPVKVRRTLDWSSSDAMPCSRSAARPRFSLRLVLRPAWFRAMPRTRRARCVRRSAGISGLHSLARLRRWAGMGFGPRDQVIWIRHEEPTFTLAYCTRLPALKRLSQGSSAPAGRGCGLFRFGRLPGAFGSAASRRPGGADGQSSAYGPRLLRVFLLSRRRRESTRLERILLA